MALKHLRLSIRGWHALITTLVALAFLLLSLALTGPLPARGAVNQVYLPNITKTLGGNDGWTTPIVVQNAGNGPSDITLTFFRFSDGKQVTQVTLPAVKPGQGITFDPRTNAALPDDTQFSAVVQSANGQAAVTVIEGSGSSWMAYTGTANGASTVYLPNITRNLGGSAGWNTPFIVQNIGTAATVATVSFYNFGDGALARRIENVALAPGRSQAFLTWAIDGLADDAQYAVVVQGPPGSQLCAVVNEQSGTMAMSYEGLLAGSQVVSLPNVLKFVGGTDHWSTPFIVQNLGATRAAFNLEFYATGSGQLVTTMPGSLEPGRSLPVDVRFTPAILPAGQYSVVVRGQPGAQLGAVVNGTDESVGMAMSYHGVGQAQAQQSVYLPLLRKNVGVVAWSSSVVAQNLGATPTDLTLTLYDGAGKIATQKTLPAVKPGASAIYDTRSDRRLAGGTYSAIVQAASPIGAVVNLSGNVAGDYSMAYTGIAGPATAIPSAGVTIQIVGASTFTLRTGQQTDMYVDAAMDAATAARAVAQADADVIQVQNDYGRQFTTIPRIYLCATKESYVAVIRDVLGETGTQAAETASRTSALFNPRTQLVVANWAAIAKYQPVSTIRHELTHVMISQIIGPNPTLPAWFNEGLAVNEEFTVKGSHYLAMLERYMAASMAANGMLIPLADLDSPLIWAIRPGRAAMYQYAEATQAVQMLQADLGKDGVLRILGLMGQGQTFQSAYQAVAGTPFADFAAAYPARVQALSASYPAIATTDDSPEGPGLSWTYFGFAPQTKVTLEVRSSIAGSVYLETTDDYGVQFGWLDASFPPGTYNLIVTDGTRRTSAIANKL